MGFLGLLGATTGGVGAGAASPAGGFVGLLGLFGLATTASGEVRSDTWLRDVLEAVRDEVETALPGYAIVHDNGPIPAMAGTWARVTATIDAMAIATMGPQHYRAAGTLTVSVFTPRARGDAATMSAAELLLGQLRGRRIASPLVRFTSVSVVGGTEFVDSWCGRTIRATFSAERDDMPATS